MQSYISPTRRYFSRRQSKGWIQLEVDDGSWVGILSPWAIFNGSLLLLVPTCYIYITLILLRELCLAFPDTLFSFVEKHLPSLARLVEMLQEHSSRFVEVWCWVEGIFFVCLKWQIRWLQGKDPLEASLSAAPIMDLDERRQLWVYMMESEHDWVGVLRGWFFDEPLENISKYDLRDWVVWAMYEGRHQEHLSTTEMNQAESFLEEVELKVSLEIFGESDSTDDSTLPLGLPKPRKLFRFPEESQHHEDSFFFDLYESYRKRYVQMMKTGEHMVPDFQPVQEFRDRLAVASADFHPVQDLRIMADKTKQRFLEAEEQALATGRHVYEKIVPEVVDKQLTAASNAAYTQLVEAWNSVRNVRERFETAQFLSNQRQRLRKQLRGYRLMLNKMLEKSSAVPSKQMASIMRQITECNQAIEHLEHRAQTAFVQATGFAQRNLPAFLKRKDPQVFAKYSSDPLLGLATYPLGFHLLVLGTTELPLRVMMRNRGFSRHTFGNVSYYYHPGDTHESFGHSSETPIAFVHGIGIGLIAYIPLIDHMIATGRPIFLPELPFVSAFRPWQSPNSVLQPAVVTSAMTAILAKHGFFRATWVGHSYGTSWLSYMCKFSPDAVAALLFLDPVCFKLHYPRLTKSFVYTRPDPGTIGYLARTDTMINWTVQRSFPWSWIDLFVEQIDVPCSIYLSECDQLVPVAKVTDYLKSKEVPIRIFERETSDDFYTSFMNCTIFPGQIHGDWTENTATTVPDIAHTMEILCVQADAFHAKSH